MMLRYLGMLFFCIVLFVEVHPSYAQKLGNVKDKNDGLCKRYGNKVPPYLPFIKKEDIGNSLFFYFYPGCKKDDFKVIVGIGSDCRGEHMCSQASFSVHPVSPSIRSMFEHLFLQSYKEIRLESMVYGYYIPPICGAYCGESKLIWFKDNHMYIVGSSFDQLDELIKSANSYILLQTG